MPDGSYRGSLSQLANSRSSAAGGWSSCSPELRFAEDTGGDAGATAWMAKGGDITGRDLSSVACELQRDVPFLAKKEERCLERERYSVCC